MSVLDDLTAEQRDEIRKRVRIMLGSVEVGYKDKVAREKITLAYFPDPKPKMVPYELVKKLIERIVNNKYQDNGLIPLDIKATALLVKDTLANSED